MASHKNVKRIWPVRQDEQQEIVRRVKGLFALADQLELRLAKARGPVGRNSTPHPACGQLLPVRGGEGESLLARA